MAIDTFNRHENKYRIDKDKIADVWNEVAAHMEADVYNPGGEAYRVLNIYYDTHDNEFIRASVAKPLYKEKLRLRAYGTPCGGSTVYVEIKKKVRGIVNKRRSGMTLHEAYEFLKDGEIPEIQPYMNEQVLNEIAYILRRKPLVPMLFLSYKRIAYSGERGLRVSFDTNIQTRRYDLRLEYGAYGESLLNEDEWLMEIKTAESVPLWMSGVLAKYKVYPTGFSKYGEEYERLLRRTAAVGARRFFVITPDMAINPGAGADVVAGAVAGA